MGMETVRLINTLVEYAKDKGLIEGCDTAYSKNLLLDLFSLGDGRDTECYPDMELSEILGALCDKAEELGIIEGGSITLRDLFDTKIMGALTPRPSEVIRKYEALRADSPELATDYFYSLAKSSNYIREDRIRRDMKWTYASEYGDIDITVNLSKPEKDPRAIALARNAKSTGYPPCALCRENEGFAGSPTQAARQNLRLIPLTLGGEDFYFQYSPYVYYNEHCIVLSAKHSPMKINRQTFVRLLDFVSALPHYFIGSNADLPIVGGSILSHEHMQGGRYTFPMERAKIKKEFKIKDFPDITLGILDWPMSVIRISGKSKEHLTDLADKILSAFRKYSDPSASIYHETEGEAHNTVTPIARRRGEDFELDLVLRNNLTSQEHPLGIFHPHSEHHNIKKENIGLIEVMGLAVLPSRLKAEIYEVKKAILENKDFSAEKDIEKHKEWFLKFKDSYTFTEENCEEILKAEIGKTFVRVLSDAGIFKNTPEGLAAFERFISHIS